MSTSHLSIGVIDSDVLGVQGDNGNAMVLKRRAEWRGIPADVYRLSVSDSIPSSYDIYIMGAATRLGRKASLDHLRRARGLGRALLRGTPVLAIMTSMHSLCEWFIDEDGAQIEGLGVLDATSMLTPYSISNALVTCPLIEGVNEPLMGHESHAAITRLGPQAAPLGRVVHGCGNSLRPGQEFPTVPARKASAPEWQAFEDLGKGPLVTPATFRNIEVYDGAIQGSIMCTYMHGPVLARNPQLADLILQRALGVDSLEPLDVPAIDVVRTKHFKQLGLDSQTMSQLCATMKEQ